MTTREKRQLRIIGGCWRSRKISFPDNLDIRPTADRVRETLFNWLAPVIPGAYCLDLFTGSGALSFEALSRGAGHVVMVDKSPRVIENLRETTTQLDIPSDRFTLYKGEAPNNIILPPKPFDVVFLDPPFRHNLIQPSCEWLIHQKLIAPLSYVYIEKERRAAFSLPPQFKILKQGKTSQVEYYLVQLDKPDAS